MLEDTFANRLKKALDMNKMKPIDLARKAKISKSLISNYLKGICIARNDKIYTISKILNVSEAWLLGYDANITRVSENERKKILEEINNKPDSTTMSIKIPVFNSLNLHNNQSDISSYTEIPINWLTNKREFFALKISDDTMTLKYLINDIVIFEKENSIKTIDKKDCIITIGSEDVIFRNVTANEAGITLVPLNLNNSNNYQPTFYSNEEIEKLPVKIIGVAIEKRTKL